MSQQRHKDVNWTFPTTASGAIEKWEYVQIAVLMDIRDELKALNRIMHCTNTIGIPHTLKRIDRRLAKKVPLK